MCLRMTCKFLEKELAISKAIIAASNAHCTIMKHTELATREELLSKKHKTCRAIKTSACYVAYDTMKEIHTAQAQEKAQRARETVEKEVQKAENEAVHEA